MTIIRPELRTKTTAGGGRRMVRGSGLEPANKDFYRYSLIDPAANNNFQSQQSRVPDPVRLRYHTSEPGRI
jgi:hypothetical protein